MQAAWISPQCSEVTVRTPVSKISYRHRQPLPRPGAQREDWMDGESWCWPIWESGLSTPATLVPAAPDILATHLPAFQELHHLPSVRWCLCIHCKGGWLWGGFLSKGHPSRSSIPAGSKSTAYFHRAEDMRLLPLEADTVPSIARQEKDQIDTLRATNTLKSILC